MERNLRGTGAERIGRLAARIELEPRETDEGTGAEPFASVVRGGDVDHAASREERIA
jgi:hypothetical protein